MIRRLCPLLLLAALPLFPASKEILDLQRDVANLQELVRQLMQAQTAQTQQLTTLGVLTQQALDASKSADKSVAVIQSGIQQSLNDEKKEIVAPVVGLSTRMDQVSNDVRTLQQAIADLTSAMSKMQAQLTDINNGVKVLQAPPQPPPSGGGGAVGGGMGQSGSPQANVPPMPATDLYNQAQNDRSAGKLDLALDEFGQFLKWYSNSELAGNAQFYIGWIHWSQGLAALHDANTTKANTLFDTAASDFDTLIQRFPDNVKVTTGEAYYYKGMSLKRGGKRTQSKVEFDNAIRTAGGLHDVNQVGQRSCDEIKDMGLTCPGAAPSRAGKKKR